jgi:hypothetical protein
VVLSRIFTAGWRRLARREAESDLLLRLSMPSRSRTRGLLLVLLGAILTFAAGHAQKKEVYYYGELEPRLYTAPELMTVAAFKPISLEDARQLGVFAQSGDRLYSGEFTLGQSEKTPLVYKAVIIRLPAGNHALYFDANRNGRFDPDERVSFLPVTNPNFPRFKALASFNVDLPRGGLFPTCPMEVAVVGKKAPPGITAPQIAVEYTATAFVRGFAVLPDRRLDVRLEYDFDAGGVLLSYGREWFDLNNDGKFDMSPGSPEVLEANGAAPLFRVGALTLQLKSVDLRRDQFVLRAIPTGPRRTHWHLPFQK